MATNNQKPALRILFLIATQKLVHKAVDLMKEEGVPVQYIMFAQGTASSEIMDMLGLGGVEKDLMLSLVPKALAGRLLKDAENTASGNAEYGHCLYRGACRVQRACGQADGNNAAGGRTGNRKE